LVRPTGSSAGQGRNAIATKYANQGQYQGYGGLPPAGAQISFSSGAIAASGNTVTINYAVSFGSIGTVTIQGGKSAAVTVNGTDYAITTIASQTDPSGEGLQRRVVYNLASTVPYGTAVFSEDAGFFTDDTGKSAPQLVNRGIGNNVPAPAIVPGFRSRAYRIWRQGR